MNRNKNILLAAISGSLVFLILAAMFVNAPVSHGPLYTCPAIPDPSVDGNVDTVVEWKDGIPLDITLFNLANQADELDIEIMSVYGADLIIYYAITIPDTAINPEDYFFMVFKTHEVNPIVENATQFGNFGAENDVKFMWFHNNHSMDAFTKGIGFTWADDVSNGGVDNGQGKCQNNGTHTTIEMAFPFNTGDTSGFDVSLFINGTTELFLWYHDEDSHKDFCQIRSTDVDWDFIKQEINCSATTPIPIAFVFFGLMVTAIAAVFYRKRRK